MKYQKKRLLNIAQRVEKNEPLSPDEIEELKGFEKIEKENKSIKFLKSAAVPASLTLGFFFAVFPGFFENLVKMMPSWTNMSDQLLSGVNYLWDLIGDPIKKNNIIYHIPNIILYCFGIVGIKLLIDVLDKKTWLDRVLNARDKLKTNLDLGRLNLEMREGHSLLFVGGGDFIGMQFCLNQPKDMTVTISQKKPNYTEIWNLYQTDALFDDLKDVIIRSAGKNCGEYVFFPVKDDQIFLPSPAAYDLSPHKLDIICQNIRILEKELGWETKRIILVGDKTHQSFVQSEDEKNVIKKSEDIISLDSIGKKYPNVTLIDPTDLVLKKLIEIAKGRKIVFRATKDGIYEYKGRFFNRLKQLGYKLDPKKKGVLTIGYDLFEDQTEQQTLAKKIDDYYPVVLSKAVKDALVRNGYKEQEFIYVPELVLTHLDKIASEQ